MKVQTVDVFQQDVVNVDGERFLTVRGAFLDFLGRTGPPDLLRFAWDGGSLDVPFPEVLANGARLAGGAGAVGWQVPDGAAV